MTFFLSLDRAIRSEETEFVDPEPLQIVKPLPDLQDQFSCVVSLRRTDQFFQSIFSSLKSGNEVSLTLIINDGTLERLE